ncbi:hypothetical protein L226DRAFT_570750 [Lentinus tigrinus ALCF2SS1-7]|uniref:REJ domain-containing protein n=1 Tax=Lentinus tigrinus ALCF2SS1-6 TaxID=1328759 RepID=A0A5C2SB78_9APHY|nr:hypothetical protein L227DRAFT_652794 [Lentinus tigrinus ALCF2SS1-6]RPD75082.1 hypothetical protein L226DRAFT_570750 [Lentinus tigrinus ALCF2SS1-7]
MLHNQSILGFSLLVLSCASPTLGDVAASPPSSLDPLSPPSSPSLGTNTGHAFKDINPPQMRDASAAPASVTGLATIIMPSASSVAAGFNPAVTPAPIVAEVSPAQTKSSLDGSSHRSAKYRAKVHSSIAAHFSSSLQLQAHTLALTTLSSSSSASYTSPLSASPTASTTISETPATTSPSSDLQVSTSMGSSATLAISSHTHSVSVLSTTALHALPTPHDLDDPNPDVHSSASEGSQRARKSAVLAALLILGMLGALGGGILCFRCGVFPCCHNRRRQRGPASAERTVEEGLRGLAKLSPSALSEKGGSLIPGQPPVANGPIVVPPLPRNMHAHTLSCSTCPPDSLNGVRGGVSGTGMGSTADIHYDTNEDSGFEDVTHILSSNVFSSDKHITSEESSTSTNLRSPRDSGTSRATRASTASGSDIMARFSTATTESAAASVHTRTSRISEGAASLTAESYTTCESRYSTPSIDRGAHDGPPSPIVEESEEEYYSPASPQSSTSTASGGSVSVLLMTPEQNNYSCLADAALPGPNVKVVSAASGSGFRTSVDCDRAASPAGSDMDIDYEGSDWDVAQAYGAPPAIPLPPAPAPSMQATPTPSGKGRGMKPVKGRPQTGVGLVGGRKVVFMHG